MVGRSRSYGSYGRRSERDVERSGKEFDHYLDFESPCIWIGGCPNDLSEREVGRACSKFGLVHSISIRSTERETFALVRYEHVSDARDAVYGLDGTAVFGAGFVAVEPVAVEAWGRGREAHHRSRPGVSGRSPRRDYDRRGNGYHREPLRPARHGHPGDWDRRTDGNGRRRSPSPRKYAPRPIRIMLSQLPRDMEEDEFTEIVAEYGAILQYELHREGAYKCGWVEYASREEAEAALGELDNRRMDDWNMRLQAYMYPGGGA